MFASRSECYTDDSDSHTWTDWFSEELGEYVSCEDTQYISQMECSGTKCDNIRLRCTEMHPNCSWEADSIDVWIEHDRWWYSTEGRVIWQVKCEDHYCGRLRFGARKMIYNA